MSLSNNFPNALPSLSLDFAGTKKLDPRITFTRGSTATFYNGVTTAKAEENLLLQSQDFTTTWANSGTTSTANTSVAPDGTTTADTLTESASGTAQANTSQTFSFVSGLPYTFSCFVKQGTETFIQLLFGSAAFGANAFANFNVTTGAGATGTVGSSTTASIVDVGNGWYRCIITATATSTVSSLVQMNIIESGTATRAPNVTLNSGTILLWGAQLEQRSSVTAYTATTTQPITNYIPVLQTAQNNVPRFEHNPVTGESLGLEIEEQRTNLLLRSEDFADAAWFKTDATITSNTIVAPDGALTGDKLVENTATSAHAVSFGGVSVTSGTSYSFSCFVKAGERTSVRLISNVSSNFNTAYFNLLTGAVTTTTGTGTVATIVNVGNGWYRCVLTFSAAATITNADFAIRTVSGTSTDNYTGNGYSGIFIWGAQLEAGAFATSYIKTEASQVTRSADAASMTGTNFSSWFNNSEGVVYCESQTVNLAGNRGTWAIGNPSLSFAAGNMIYEEYSSGSSGRRIAGVYTNGSAQASSLGAVVSQTANTFSKGAFTYKVNDFAQTTNAAAVVTDTLGTVPLGVTGLSIGDLSQGWSGATTYLNGTIRKFAYYPARLSNAQLQALTTI